ncbi:MAG: hypothetical protein DYG83_11695 [Candidatus Brocadia sp. AMX2]|nr:hypothetical protein [Candidatus Brocadia sp. AMX1]MCE7867468.1 hypothetical protein [Candidatus Brocadia sp. AMX2]RIJ90617.1 MAG: hypothetical protein DB853_11185 [Candidatus Brocadia sp.]
MSEYTLNSYEERGQTNYCQRETYKAGHERDRHDKKQRRRIITHCSEAANKRIKKAHVKSHRGQFAHG